MDTIIRQLRRLHRDERGAEGLEKLLIVAAIILPLLGVLIYYVKDISTWVKSIWETAKGDAPLIDNTVNNGVP